MQGYGKINENNIILKTDSYKISHYKFLPPGMEEMFLYLEARNDRNDFGGNLFFGSQYIFKRHLVGKVLSREMIMEAGELLGEHFVNREVFNKQGFERLLKKHDGVMPLRIRAVPEGMFVPPGNVLMTVESTDPEFYWLPGFVEPLLLQVWKPSTVATYSRQCKKTMAKYWLKTSDKSLDSMDFKLSLHDFGFRGSDCWESSGIAGMAHLVNFRGTDTLSALVFARNYYGEKIAGYTVPATEHATTISWGREREKLAYENAMDAYPTGTISIVVDSYDVFKAVENLFCGSLKERVLKRDGKIVMRPDSGNPATVVKKLLDILWENFGGSVNGKGFRVINPKSGLIQGDKIDLPMIEKIFNEMMLNKFSAENLSLGSGGALLQKHCRDDHGFSIKPSWARINGGGVDMAKCPITDPSKASKEGRIVLVERNGLLTTVREDNMRRGELDILETVFENGDLIRDCDLESVRKLAELKPAELAN